METPSDPEKEPLKIECSDGITRELKLRNPNHPEAGWMQIEIDQVDETEDSDIPYYGD